MTTDELFGREVTVKAEPEPEDEVLQDDVFEEAETAEECEYCEAEEVDDSEPHKTASDNDKITIDLSFIKNLGKDIANGLKGFKSDVETSIKNAGINWGSSTQETQTADEVDSILESFNSIYARLCNSCDARIIKSDRFEIKAWGSKKFIDSLSFGVTNGKLNVVMKNYVSANENNHLEIYVNFDKGEMIDVNTSGAVDLDIEPDFEVASFVTSGACDVNAKNFGQVVSKLSGACDFVMGNALDADFLSSGACDIKIENVENSFRAVASGSGDVKANSVRNAYVQISGSGNADINNASGDLTVKLSGSGDVNASGNADNLCVSVSGSCDFDGSSLTANEADISASGPCNVEIGRVYGPLKQNVDRISNVKINNRG